jgi:hypothetical protein
MNSSIPNPQRRRFLVGAAGASALGAAALIGLPQIVTAAPPLEARVKFGNNHAMRNPSEHGQHFHAFDKISPRTVTIGAGGTVTFDFAPFHQGAIYGPNVEPSDIDLSPENLDDLNITIPGEGPIFIPDFLIADPDNRLALSDLVTPNLLPYEWSYTFTEAGRYLVLCTILPHFVEAKMYAYVIVK